MASLPNGGTAACVRNAARDRCGAQKRGHVGDFEGADVVASATAPENVPWLQGMRHAEAAHGGADAAGEFAAGAYRRTTNFPAALLN